MQVTVSSNFPPGSAAQAVTPPNKVASSAVAPVDLRSSVPPLQPLESASASASSTVAQSLVYARPAASARNSPPSASARNPEEGSMDARARLPERTAVEDASVAVGSRSDEREPAEDGEDRSRDARDQRASGRELDEAELSLIRELASRDREVRQHEQAHVSVGGPYAGAPSFRYERGPDGRPYAVSGEVPIDVAPIPGNPEATLRKMEVVRRAALAPAETSPQDRQVAALANQLTLQAQSELSAERTRDRREQAEKRDGENGEGRVEAGREAASAGRAESSRPADLAERADRRSDRRADADERPVPERWLGEAIRTYEDLIRLGQLYEQGASTRPSLRAVV